MNILVLGTIDNKGGAAQVSWELRKKLKADGHKVSTFVRYKYSNETDVFIIPRRRFQDWLVKLFANDLTFANTDYIFNTKEYKEADIIHCHNLHSNFFNLKQLIRMSREKPLIWTMHDIWAITGYASDSATRINPNKKKFLLYLWDNTNNLLSKKKKIYEKSKILIVAVSKWLECELKKSILNNQEIVCIYNGIDTTIFKPYDKKLVRKELALPLDKKIVMFGIKGWVDSNKIIDDYIKRDDLYFIAIGHSHIKTLNKNSISINYIKDRDILSKYLSASDIFLHPTNYDTFGLIVAEAMSSGTPVVTYGIDAIPEIVLHKQTGYIAKYKDVEDLKSGIEYILNLPYDKYNQMCVDARNTIKEKFTLEKMYQKYLNLYTRLLSGQNDKR
jgi:glycosyltransferase involved in cell wall biosynthesis